MKHLITIIILTASTFITLLGHAQKIDETAVTFLVDATEKNIFDAIETDFNQNLNVFFNNAGIGKIGFGQRLTIRMGAIDESNQLTLQSRSIALTDKKVSRKQAESLRNPRPLLELISAELAKYKQLSEKNMALSPIIDVTLKAFREMNTEAREIIVISTDGLENSNYANFYKNIPTSEQAVEKLISKTDNILLVEAKEAIAATDPEVVIILKPNDKVKKTAELKKFYNEFFRQLGINTIRFIDNLSNNPNL